MKTNANTPLAATNPRIRSRIRDVLVTLGQSPGLGVKIIGKTENCVLIYPRAGHPVENKRDVLALTWYELDEETLTLTLIEDIEPFLCLIA